MSEKKHIEVKIPRDLAKDMDGLVGKHGFKTRAEIAKEGIRRLLREYGIEVET